MDQAICHMQQKRQALLNLPVDVAVTCLTRHLLRRNPSMTPSTEEPQWFHITTSADFNENR